MHTHTYILLLRHMMWCLRTGAWILSNTEGPSIWRSNPLSTTRHSVQLIDLVTNHWRWLFENFWSKWAYHPTESLWGCYVGLHEQPPSEGLIGLMCSSRTPTWIKLDPGWPKETTRACCKRNATVWDAKWRKWRSLWQKPGWRKWTWPKLSRAAGIN